MPQHTLLFINVKKNFCSTSP